MQANEIARRLAGSARIVPISAGSNHVFRLYGGDGQTSILKLYGAASYQRRERRALEALAGLPGLPIPLEWGSTDDFTWVRMVDAGTWNLASLLGRLDTVAQAGAILRGVHDADHTSLSNLEDGMDADRIAADARATLTRLQRYRRRLRIPADLFDRIDSMPVPAAGPPRAAHTRPEPEDFVVAEDGTVTLTSWRWATLAPPEWDFTYAYWRLSARGRQAAEAFTDGYGASIDSDSLRAWTAYHTASYLLRQAESRDGRLEDLQPYVEQLVAAVS